MRNKKSVILIVIILILVGGFVYFSRPAANSLSDKQKAEEATNILKRKALLTDQQPKSPSEYTDKYVSFSYPGEATIYQYKDPDFKKSPGLLSMFSYDIKTPKSVFNYVAYKRANISSLDEDSSYNLRTLPERGYSRKIIKLDGISATLFSKNETPSSERSIFVMSKGVVYSFLFTGSDSDELDRLVKQLEDTLKWVN